MRNNKLTLSIQKALSLGAKTTLLSVGATALSLGIQATYFSVGAGVLSLGINLTQLDNNDVMAAGLANVSQATTDRKIGGASVNASVTSTVTYSVVGYGDNPVVYASEIFGTTPPSALPNGTTERMMAIYTFDGTPGQTFNAKFTLDNGATFGSVEAHINAKTYEVPLTVATGTGAGKNVASYEIKAVGTDVACPGTSAAGEDCFTIVSNGGSDHLYLLYTLASTSALKTPGQKINLSVEMKTPEPSSAVQVGATIPIAESKQGLKVTLTGYTDATAADDRITVESGNTEFVGTGATNEAKIGNLKIEKVAGVYDIDGVTAWNPGVAPLLDTETSSDNSRTMFTITNGQFAASTKSPGQVKIMAGSTPITIQATDETTATFYLSDTSMTNIIADTGGADISIVADGKTAINVPEDPPVGELYIEYTDNNYQKITYPAVELTKIKQDGMRCIVYNVPAVGSADIVAVRITNDSGSDGIVNATLYDGDGNEIFPATPLNDGNPIKKGATLAVFNADLAKLGSWTGRGVLVLTTTLSSMEVLSLLREAGNNEAPLTNLSTGASGSGCTN